MTNVLLLGGLIYWGHLMVGERFTEATVHLVCIAAFAWTRVAYILLAREEPGV